MKVINSCSGFSWASEPNKNGLAEASVAHESFWIRECVDFFLEGKAGFKGKVDNNLLFTEVHGLKYGDDVFFVPTDY